MKQIAEIRNAIYDYFQGSAECQKFFYDLAHEEESVTYYNSMYLLQDTTESLWNHRKAGFSGNPLQAYIEFWGVMQAVFIQQEAIAELCEIITGKKLNPWSIKKWAEIRLLRNICAGHPVKKDIPRTASLTRSFMGRSFGGYNEMVYEQWQTGSGRSNPRIKLGVLLDEYAIEAAAQLDTVFSAMKKRWP